MNNEQNCPRVSVVIIAYNDETHIERAIQSVCNQTERNIEIICVDDGSTDTTCDRMRRSAERDERIRVITQPNGGIVSARAAGLQQAIGEYTLLLDSDDLLMPKAIETACDAADASSADVLEFGVDFVEDADTPPDKETMRWLRQHFSMDRPLPETDHGPALVKTCFVEMMIPSTVWNKLYKTELLRAALQYYDGEWVCMLEDMLITLMVLCRAEHYARIPSTLYVHFVGGGMSAPGAGLNSHETVKNAATMWMPVKLAREWLEKMEYPLDEIADGMAAYNELVCDALIDRFLNRCAPEFRSEFLEWLFQCCEEKEFCELISEAVSRQQGYLENLEEIRREIEVQNRQLSKKTEAQQAQIDQLEEQNRYLSEKTEAQQAQIDQLEAQNRYLSESFDTISNAFFWKITKPARFTLDVMKWAAQPYVDKGILRKGLYSLRTNGPRVTWQKAMQKIYSGDSFAQVAKQALFTEEELAQQRKHRFSKDVKFSIVVPLYNTPESFLREMIESVLAQTYADWELCMADGSDAQHADVQRICKEYVCRDNRIRYQKLEKNLGISGNTNACLEMVTGEYIGLFDHDDLLHPAALFEVMRTIENTGADFVYTDEAVFVSPDINKISNVHFKPDFAPDNLRANNYICHFTLFKRSLLDQVGSFDPACDGSQDHDMVLRLTEKAQRVTHIPEILYYWRAHTGSVAESPGEKPYVIEAGIRATEKQLERLGLEGSVAPVQPGQPIYRIRYAIKGKPMVSILIANHEHKMNVEKCLTSIFEKTTWPDYEIVIIENKNNLREHFSRYKEIQRKHNNVRIVEWDKTDNSSAISNYGAQFCTGEYLLLLNSDIEVITPDWIEEMLMLAQREDVGAVGAKLYYPDNTIQSAGICLGMRGTAGSFFQHVSRNSIGYMGRLLYVQNVSAVSSACMMLRREIWDKMGGLDEGFQASFNDIDMCMRMRKAGYFIVWTPYAELIHYKSKSRRREDIPEKQKHFEGEALRFQARWAKELEAGDPYYNPNFSLDRSDFFVKPDIQQYDAR